MNRVTNPAFICSKEKSGSFYFFYLGKLSLRISYLSILIMSIGHRLIKIWFSSNKNTLFYLLTNKNKVFKIKASHWSLTILFQIFQPIRTNIFFWLFKGKNCILKTFKKICLVSLLVTLWYFRTNNCIIIQLSSSDCIVNGKRFYTRATLRSRGISRLAKNFIVIGWDPWIKKGLIIWVAYKEKGGW